MNRQTPPFGKRLVMNARKTNEFIRGYFVYKILSGRTTERLIHSAKHPHMEVFSTYNDLHDSYHLHAGSVDAFIGFIQDMLVTVLPDRSIQMHPTYEDAVAFLIQTLPQSGMRR